MIVITDSALSRSTKFIRASVFLFSVSQVSNIGRSCSFCIAGRKLNCCAGGWIIWAEAIHLYWLNKLTGILIFLTWFIIDDREESLIGRRRCEDMGTCDLVCNLSEWLATGLLTSREQCTFSICIFVYSCIQAISARHYDPYAWTLFSTHLLIHPATALPIYLSSPFSPDNLRKHSYTISLSQQPALHYPSSLPTHPCPPEVFLFPHSTLRLLVCVYGWRRLRLCGIAVGDRGAGGRVGTLLCVGVGWEGEGERREESGEGKIPAESGPEMRERKEGD